MSVATYHVPNISCGHCVHTIKTEIGALAGIRRVEVDQMAQRVDVEYEEPADDASLRQALTEIDYPAD